MGLLKERQDVLGQAWMDIGRARIRVVQQRNNHRRYEWGELAVRKHTRFTGSTSLDEINAFALEGVAREDARQ